MRRDVIRSYSDSDPQANPELACYGHAGFSQPLLHQFAAIEAGSLTNRPVTMRTKPDFQASPHRRHHFVSAGSSHKSSWSTMTEEMVGGQHRNDEATQN